MKPADKSIEVFADWSPLDGPTLMGSLQSRLLRGKEVFSFEYNPDWIRAYPSTALDPNLGLYSGPQYLADDDAPNFGVFLDSSPDRWGRVLMKRREAAKARKEDRPEVPLNESDYLLGVFDEHRIGGLRFKSETNGPFQNADPNLSVPPWTSLRELEAISWNLESDNAPDDIRYLEWLNQLLAPGSSLGGARPKAGVKDPEGHLWIAKFPSRSDGSDSGAWEMLTHILATKAGLSVSEAQAKSFSKAGTTFLTKRFDRSNDKRRLHFASAMTMLGYRDGVKAADGASYLEIAEFIVKHGTQVNKDLEELWRRIVFNISVSNTDDHLRNHGFLLEGNGWILSPAYDMNPEEEGTGLSLNISDTDNALDLDLAMEVLPYFRLDEKRGNEIVHKVTSAVSEWRILAKEMGIARTESELKERAFYPKD